MSVGFQIRPFLCLAILLTFSQTGLAQIDKGAKLKLPDGFVGELVYEVPSKQGSWVCLTTDPQGRLIASDQYGNLYRITTSGDAPKVEVIDLAIGRAQGLLCAFDALYVVSNRGGKKTGLFRVTDKNDDDQYDHVELLRKFDGKSEHGPHAVILSPDKKSLYVCAGNATKLPEISSSRLPQTWQEDQIVARLPDPGGHAVGRLAPGGWICKTDPGGKSFELISAGFRNQYDIAFNRNGDLFTYDADMEWDLGLPWYRPTRICHVVSGAEFGWRFGSGKWPEYYPDSVPPVENIGPGSPTGVAFGYNAAFPANYQNALFVGDWSYGIIYAVTLEPYGASYRATREQFCSAPALPVTDLVINPVDGSMYFLIGGRKSQSALYRIRYTGGESTKSAVTSAVTTPEAKLRRSLEQFHSDPSKIDLELTWKALGHSDRMVRYAARIALEHQPSDSWASRLSAETDAQRIIEGSIAMIRSAGSSDAEKKAASSTVDAAIKNIHWNKLSTNQRLSFIRAMDLSVCRLGETSKQLLETVEQLETSFPTGANAVDRELAKLLVATGNQQATAKVVELLGSSPGSLSQIDYALTLIDAESGWTDELRAQYFGWFSKIASAKGGNSFGGYVLNIKKNAVEKLSDQQRSDLAEIIDTKPYKASPAAQLESRPLVKKWAVDDFLPADEEAISKADIAHGRELFSLTNCYNCHRIQMEGGVVGPDLTTAGHRFSTKDLLTAIIDPNKEISDQYEATIFQMEDGQLITGRVANLNGDEYWVQSDMNDPGNFVKIKVDEIEDMAPSKVSMMPSGLLDTLEKDEVLDLLAYLKSAVSDSR